MAGNVDWGPGPEFIQWPVISGTGMVLLPHSRYGHVLKTNLGGQVAFSYQYGELPMTDVFTDAGYSVMLDAYSVTIPGSFGPEGGLIGIIDETTGETAGANVTATTTSFDLGTWHVRRSLLLKISASRWGNSLQVRSASGHILPVTPRQIQGDWSWSLGGVASSFNTYGFFDAEADAYADVPWHLYDATREEMLAASETDNADFSSATDNTNSDSDSLPDWYERLIGTNEWEPDTDGDGVNDDVEIAAGTNPRAVQVTANSSGTLIVHTPLRD